MQKSLKLIALVMFFASCGKSPEGKSNGSDSLKAVNQAAYNSAMDVHDAVMPKLDSIVILKRSLNDALSAASITPEKKSEYESKIQLLDSAYDAMMDWMHDQRLRPPQDTTDQKSYQLYMAKKVESAKKMSDLIKEAIKQGKI